MIDLTKFKESHKDKEQKGSFSENDLNSLKGKVSDEIIEFLKQEGKASYGNGFFRTVLPNEYHTILSDWGLNGSECYAFMISPFGSIIYYSNLKYFCLNPFLSNLNKLGKNFDLLMNIQLKSESMILEEYLWQPFYIDKKSGLPTLNEDEIYGITPTVPEGGSPETSKIEVVKLKDHLHKLAELYDHTIEED